MNPNLRRILLITGFILVVIGIGYVIYVTFFKPTALVPVNNTPSNVNGLLVPGNGNVNRVGVGNINALPIVNALIGTTAPTRLAQGGPTETSTVTTTETSGLTLSGATNDLLYYDRATGRFYRLSPDGSSKTPLGDAVYKDVQNITWSPKGSQAILEFPDGSKVLYDFDAKQQSTLPKELSEFSFSPQSDKIVSKFLDPTNTDNQWLMVSQPNGTQSTAAEHLGENARYVEPAWSPNNQIIATYEKSTNADQSEIIFLGAKDENFQSAQVDGRGFLPNWAPDGRRLLYSVYSPNTEDNPHLFIMNGSPNGLGTGLTDLGLDTRADKCTFSGSGLGLYCAVPYYMNPGSGPQPALSAGVPDNIYFVDLQRGSSTLIARPVDQNLQQRFSATNLKLTPTEDALYFIDALTGNLEKIQLK